MTATLDEIQFLLDCEAMYSEKGEAHLTFVSISRDEEKIDEEQAKRMLFECLSDPRYKLVKEWRHDQLVACHRHMNDKVPGPWTAPPMPKEWEDPK